MNQIALYFGERAIYWSSLIITLGVLCCLSLTVALYRQRSETLRELLVFFPLAVILSLFLSRLLCWYFSVDVFDSFGEAFSDFSLGSFYLPGVILGVWLAMEGSFTLGMILSFQGFLSAFLAPAMTLVSAGQTIQEMRTEMERVEDVMAYPADQRLSDEPLSGDTDYSKLKGNVELKHVTFGYSPLGAPLIENFSMSMKPGSRVAFVGTSG